MNLEKPPVTQVEKKEQPMKNFNANEAARLAAATVIFGMALIGLHFNVQYSGWGIFLAVIIVWNVL